MRTTCHLLLAMGLSWYCVEAAQAQTKAPTQAPTKEGPVQRFFGMFSKTKNDGAKTKADSAKAEPRAKPSDASRANTANPYETRGVVFVEEPMVPGQPSKTPVSAVVPAKATVNVPAPPTRTQPTVAKPQMSAPADITSKTPVQAVASPKTGAPANDTTAQRLSRLVSQACPQARNVKVAFTGANEITVELDVRNMEECNALAGQVFSIRDLDSYRVNLKFNVPQNEGPGHHAARTMIEMP